MGIPNYELCSPTRAGKMAVAGIGVTPITEPLHNSGIELKDGVVVNEYLETNRSDILAAGDVASYYDALFDKLGAKRPAALSAERQRLGERLQG